MSDERVDFILSRINVLLALLDDLKKAVTVNETTTDSVPNGLLESARYALKQAAHMSRREKYNTIVVIGRPGSGKTHFLNELLNVGLGRNRGSGLILTQAIIVERLRILSVNNNDTYWTPQLLEHAQEFTSDASAFPQLYPDVYTPSSADILPEGDMFSTTKVPIHLVYGCAVRISIVYASPQVVDRELKKLLNVLRTQRVEKLDDLNIAREGEIGSEFITSTIFGDDESLYRAFSILGLPYTQDVCALELNDIGLPVSVAQCLGRTVSCRLSKSLLSESLSYVRALLQNLICGENSRWGLLDYIIVELPCQAIPRGVEVIDTPGFGTQFFKFSDHLRSVLSVPHDIICICDERKLDGDLAGFLKQTFFERLSAADYERRLLNICTMTRATGDKAIQEALLQARLEEFANMVCIPANSLSFNSRALFVKQYCKVMLSQIGQRDFDECFLQHVDFILKPNRTRLLRIELEEHRLAALESTFISFLLDCSRILIENRTSCVQHLLHVGDETGDLLQCQELQHKLTNLVICTAWTKSAVDSPNQPQNWTEQMFRHRIASLLPFQADGISTDTSLLSEMCKACRDFVSENLTNIPVKVLHSLYCLKFNMIHCFYDSARFLEASSCVHDTQMFEECSMFSGYELHSEGINEQLAERISFQSVARQLSQKLIDYISRFDEAVKFSPVQSCGISMRVPEFFACSTWIFYTISIHTYALREPLDLRRVMKPAELGKLILDLYKICQVRNVPPYLCSSFSLSEAALCDSLFDHHENTLSARNRFNRLHLLVSSLRKIFGSSHMDFCFAARMFSGYYNGQTPSIARFVSHLEKSESHSEALHEADFLYFTINAIRRLSCERLPGFDVEDEQLESLVLLALQCTGRNEHIIPSKLTEQIVRAQRHLLKCWGPSYVNFCRAEMYYEPQFYIPKLSKRDTIIHDALQCLEREALSSECFFREWGSDILVSLYFFSRIASDRVGEYCLKVAKYIGQRWTEIHSYDSKNWSSEDVLYYNEALFALHRLGFNCSELRREVSQNAHRWNIHQYSGLEPGESVTYDGLNSLMIWSFFFRGTGIAVQGSSEEAVESMCRKAVLSLDTKVEDDTLRTFKEKCYFVTHRIFTCTSWCSLKPVCGRFEIERRFLLYYLPFLQAAEDLELVGEFVQTLKCLGHTENENDIKNAVEYILTSRDPEKGGWGPDSYLKFDKTYHTTICALGALF